MKKLLILTIISAIGFSQTEEWIYFVKETPGSFMGNRIKPDGSNEETLFVNTWIFDIDENAEKLLLFETEELYSTMIYTIESGEIDTLNIQYYMPIHFTNNDTTLIMVADEGDFTSIWKYNIISEEITMLADSVVGSLCQTISPDKSILVYHKGHWSEMGTQEIVTVDISSGLNTTLATNGSASFEGSLIAWGNAGYIYYEGGGNDTIPKQIWKVYYDGGEDPTPISFFQNECFSPVVSTNFNEEKVLFSVGTGAVYSVQTIYQYQLTDDSLTEIVSDSIFIWFKSWSPDNSKFVYNTFTDSDDLENYRLVVYDFDTGFTTTIADSALGGLWVGNSELNIFDYSELLPLSISLKQNYPNPFNPVTTISYQIPFFGFVEMFIYNINGKLVETLVNQNQQQGTQSVLWDSNNLSSGVYFYQLKLNGEVLGTKQAILLK